MSSKRARTLPHAPKKSSVWTVRLESGIYEISGKGVFRLSLPDTRQRICGAVKPVEHHRYLGQDEIMVALRVRDLTGERKTILVPPADFLSPHRLVERLCNAGLEVADRAATMEFLTQLYGECLPKKTVISTPMPGWHEIPSTGRHVYVTNQHTFRPQDCSFDMVLAKAASAGFASAGSLSDWNERVGKLCDGNPFLQFAVCVPLAGFLVRHFGPSNCGFLFFGLSKTGKSISLKTAASVIGAEHYVRNWNATANALEALALAHNDSVLLLDELGQGDPKAVSEAVYDLMNGRTKSRLGSDVKLDAGQHFAGVVLASGERDLRTHLQASGIAVQAGQTVRLISIPVPEKRGVFTELHGLPDAGALGAALARNAARCHGALAAAYLTYVVRHLPELKASLPRKIRRAADALLERLDDVPERGVYHHVANCFALVAVASELAIACGMLAWRPGDAKKAVRKCFSAWSRHERTSAPMSDKQVLDRLRRFFQSEDADQFLLWRDFGNPERDKHIGYRHVVDGIPVFLVYPDFFEATICKGIGKSQAMRVLKGQGLLMTGARDTPTRQIHIPKDRQRGGSEKVSLYVVRQEILHA